MDHSLARTGVPATRWRRKVHTVGKKHRSSGVAVAPELGSFDRPQREIASRQFAVDCKRRIDALLLAAKGTHWTDAAGRLLARI